MLNNTFPTHAGYVDTICEYAEQAKVEICRALIYGACKPVILYPNELKNAISIINSSDTMRNYMYQRLGIYPDDNNTDITSVPINMNILSQQNTNEIGINRTHNNNANVVPNDEPNDEPNYGGRRSKRSHRKTQKGKSRKHRSKGGRRGKSRKH